MKKILFHTPLQNIKYSNNVKKLLDSNKSLHGPGKNIFRIKKDLKKYFGFNHVHLTNSCTSAMEICALMLNLNRVHLGQKPKVVKKYFSKNFKTIRKFWVTEDGGRLYLKRNLHWIIQYNGKKNIPGNTYRWMTLWELDKFIKMGHYVGPHLRSILSLV